MAKKAPQPDKSVAKQVRCAIYARKSTEEGLQQEFNSLDAQRESAEAYIASQKTEGWVCVPDRYEDGGFTGANMERPALKRLIADIEAGKIDCVIVYKVDRLSRSLLDFSRLMETFDKNKVSFVSVTQHFNTTHSMGRLTLNILLSFAQFEREIISERTRDKIAAARRRGKWSGGHPPLGYDVLSSPVGSKLVVCEDEATRIRAIYELYLQHEKLIPVVRELNQRGWNSKVWTTKQGNSRGGLSFDKTSLFRLLTNPVYIGKITYHDEVHAGEHTAIVDEKVWQRVQIILRRNGQSGGSTVKNKYGALLRGLVRCAPCDSMMSHTFTSKGTRRYRYYACIKAQKRGWTTCPSKSIPAGELEKFVVERIRHVSQDPTILAATLEEVRRQYSEKVNDLESERRALIRDLKRQNAVLRRATDSTKASRLVDAIGALELQITEVTNRMAHANCEVFSQDEMQDALARFDPVWETLTPGEQARMIQLLVECVDYDGARETISITFRPNGIKMLANQSGEAAA